MKVVMVNRGQIQIITMLENSPTLITIDQTPLL